MGRFENSLALAKASWRVLRDDRQLAVLPLCSMVASLLVALTFLAPIALVAHDGSTGGWTVKPVDWVLAVAGYLVLTYVVVFFNAALVFAADRRLAGEQITLGEALRAASQRSHVLVPWVVLSATVSLVLRAVEQRGGLGRLVGSLAGVAWSVVTFLVLPILVLEGTGPIDAVKRSGELFKRTWGENLMTNAGISLVMMLVAVGGAIPLLVLLAIGGAVAVLGVVLLVAWIVVVSLVGATLTGILQVALYRFATGGVVPGFETDDLRGMFRNREQRGWLS